MVAKHGPFVGADSAAELQRRVAGSELQLFVGARHGPGQLPRPGLHAGGRRVHPPHDPSAA